ncbi:MAG: HEAT repeat domain-containing protein [Pseudanabaenaceae cyanobacterium SKYGB_i_bin29]|nr:HEAT repeat domain-containing protein [Pseudanabaenaceae cyanobacterium SKYG29]MDW8421041.1 HEAT repeat domain-containing protein [Pseudanabaenaceae cyanobacterium SKYGB_i_bin29]
MTFADFHHQLQTKHPDRLRVMHQSRSLSLPERFQLMCLAVQDENPRIRYDAVSQLGTVGTVDLERTRQILETVLQSDPEVDVRAAAADSLGVLQITSAFPLLVHAYRSSRDWLLQLSIVAALGTLGVREAFPVLVEATTSENELVQISAIRALGDLGDERAVEVVAQFRTHADWQVRHAVVQALSHLGEKAKPLLQELIQDPVSHIAEAARLGLGSD